MKLLVFSDIHASKDSAFTSALSSSGLTRYQDLLLASFGFVADVARSVNPDILVFGGDCFHSPEYIDTRSLNVVARGFYMLRDLAKERIAIVGNHDIYSSGTGLHSLEVIRGAGWDVFDSPSSIVRCGLPIGIAPYQKPKEVELPSGQILLSHLDVVGALRRSMKSSSDLKALSDVGINSEELEYSVILNGHYHTPSNVGSRLVNVGSLLCRDFSDKGSCARGVVVYADGEITRIENPHAEYFEEFYVSSEDDIVHILERDSLERTNAKIYFKSGFDDYVSSISDTLAGSWLYPLEDRVEPPKELRPLNAMFSLEDNLRGYVLNKYNDASLAELATDILESVDSTSGVQTRAPVDILRVEIKGYQSIGYILCELEQKGLILLRGENRDSSDSTQVDNGAGKSSFVEAIYWCLTGSSLRGCRGDDVVSWNDTGCYVAVEMKVGSEIYTQVRSRHDTVHGTGSFLYRCALEDTEGSTPISGRLKSSSKEQLLSLIGRDESSLKQLVFMVPGGQRFTSMGHEKRARLIEDILGAYPYKLAQKLASSRLDEVGIELASKRGELNAHTSSISGLVSSLDDVTKRISDHEVSDEVASTEDELAKLENKKRESEDRLRAIEKEHNELSLVVLQLRKKIAGFEDSADELRSKESVLKSEVRSLEARVKHFESCSARKLCPECEEPTNTVRINEKLGEARQALEPKRQELSSVAFSREKRVERLNDLRAHVRSREDTLEKHASTMKAIRKALTALQEPLSSIKARELVMLEQLNRLKSSKSILEQELASTREVHHAAEQEVSTLDQQWSMLQKLRDDVFDESGVRSELLSQVAIPFLNNSLKSLSHQIVGRSVSLSSSRKLKSGAQRTGVEIVEEGRRSYISDSDGERARVDISMQLALNDLATATGRSRFGLLVIDETLASMDAGGLHAVCDYLEGRGDGLTVLLTTHSIPPVGPAVWTAVKEGGVTRLVLGSALHNRP